MSRITWDGAGQRFIENGVDHGVLYPISAQGTYPIGVPWNGLTAVTESPSGAEPTKIYADNIQYATMISAEEFGATVEAYTYPIEFLQCDGTAVPVAGVQVGQQGRKAFGLSYRTRLANDLNTDLGYKLHLVYGALAAPTEKAFATINESPEAMTFSWEISTTPAAVPGLKPSAILTIVSTEVSTVGLAALEDALYGTAGGDPRLPTPEEVLAFFTGTVTQVNPTAPAYVLATKTITIPTVVGVAYQIDGVTKAPGAVVITKDTVVTAVPLKGYKFPAVSDDDWYYSIT